MGGDSAWEPRRARADQKQDKIGSVGMSVIGPWLGFANTGREETGTGTREIETVPG